MTRLAVSASLVKADVTIRVSRGCHHGCRKRRCVDLDDEAFSNAAGHAFDALERWAIYGGIFLTTSFQNGRNAASMVAVMVCNEHCRHDKTARLTKRDYRFWLPWVDDDCVGVVRYDPCVVVVTERNRGVVKLLSHRWM